MTKMKLLATAATLALASFASAAQAATYLFTFTDSASVLQASGSLTTTNTLNALGGYDVLSISGSVTGYGAITSLVVIPNQPNQATTPSGNFIYDNVIYLAVPPVGTPGILFTTAGFEWNIYFNGTSDNLVGAPAGTFNFIPSVNGTNGTFALTAVPEPATWAMMISGFGLVGYAARRRRVTVRFATT